MSISEKIRAQIIGSFRAELSEHVQTLNAGLLAVEQNQIPAGEREERLATIFRAAHSLKGAARAVGVSAIEQLAHALEDVLGGLQKDQQTPSPEMFTACYKAIDAIQAVEAAYEAGETTPPTESLVALSGLEPFRRATRAAGAGVVASPEPENAGEPKKESKTETARPKTSQKGLENLRNTLIESKEAASSIPAPDKEPPQPEEETGTPVLSAAQAAPFDETIRVSVSKLDALMDQLNELLVTKIRAEQRLTQVRQAQSYVAHWQKDWLKVRGGYGRLSRHRALDDGQGAVHASQRKEFDRLLDYVQVSQEHLKELSALLNSLTREYHSDTMQMSLVIDRLEEEVKRVRMLPFKTIAIPFGRMVRDLAQASGKEAAFEMLGGEVELDKRVLEQVKDPIIHLLRNAIDHGIETPARRAAGGKPGQGKITLSVEQMGKDVAISIQDDGAGLELQTIRETALRRKVKDAATLTDAELIELIYTPGFSTSTMITDVSGRGVGLDVVRRNVENLHGRIQLDSKPGQGTVFTLLLPVTLTTSRGLLVRIAGQAFAIPVNAVERIMHVRPSEIQLVSGRQTVRYAGRPLNLVHLADVLGIPHPNNLNSREYLPVVILSSAERQIAFIVDALLDEQEVVVKSLGKQIARVGGIAGASLLGSGEVLLVLNVADLVKIAWRDDHRPLLTQDETDETTAQVRAKNILVVDDSITTRTLEKNILEAAGYIVRLALDGQEAFNTLMTSELPDLVISDIQMPRMDGFSLTARIKKEPRTANLPVILVTSLDSPEDKARGVDAGADAYIVKRSFDQINLLETITQLI
jgi:two-component system chemotaxis sensor kinase CheA